MPSTLTSDHTTPLTRADLGLWKIDLKRELQQQVRADVEEVLMRYDVRSELRKDLRTEMESLFRERDTQRSERLHRVYMTIMGAVYVAFITAAVVGAILSS
ncbi:MAG: hypothetical protein OXH86_20265 [Acidimicrobiaceae bacterium]|nr:hypothetical protein [Acidimicrobiaceae bacterium]MDE0499681.1 hypothetical protein [Acidimicrobiaceae bacterium]